MNTTTEAHKLALNSLITIGKEQGYLTYSEINDLLPEDLLTPEQIEPIVTILEELDIVVADEAPDADTLVMESGGKAQANSAEVATAALAALDSEFGRTTDPVRMYMREMGTVELLTREGEIVIAKRIEAGLKQVHLALARFPSTHTTLLNGYILHVEGKQRLTEVMLDFVDPDAPEEPIPVAKKPADVLKKDAAASGKKVEEEENETLEEFENEFGEDIFGDPELEKEKLEALKENEEEIKKENELYKEGKLPFYEKVNPLSDVPAEEWSIPSEYKGRYGWVEWAICSTLLDMSATAYR